MISIALENMKIALMHEMLVKLGGAERVVKTLSDLYPKAPIYTLFNNLKKTPFWFGERDIKTSQLQKKYRFLGSPKPLLPLMPRAVESLDFSGYDVVISSSSAFAHGIKTDKKTKHICYCHSPMRYTWDYTHQYAKDKSALMQWLIAKMLHPLRQWDYRVAARADVVVANSEHVKRRVEKYWRCKAQVIYPPVNVKRFKMTPHHENYFLIVSALTPFKRIDLAIQAFNKIKKKLIVIGDGAQRKYLESIAGPTVEFLGRKSDAEVKTYMEHCRAFIFPGEEDFGITPVEAMAAGKPVLAYGVGGVKESVQEGITGEFFESQTVDSLLKGLTRLLENEDNYDPKKIRKRAELFDEAVFVKKIKALVGKMGRKI